AEALFASVRLAVSPMQVDLVDWSFVKEHVKKYSTEDSVKWWKAFPEAGSASSLLNQGSGLERRCRRVVASSFFNLLMVALIAANALFVAAQ
ncbi:unnamed protein product, partial [Prorocentrum cordatum]